MHPSHCLPHSCSRIPYPMPLPYHHLSEVGVLHVGDGRVEVGEVEIGSEDHRMNEIAREATSTNDL